MSLKNTYFRFIANGGESFTIGNQSVSIPAQEGFYSRRMNFADGTGANKAQKWSSTAISLAAGAATTIDLTAATGIVPGTTVNFSAIKSLILENSAVEQEVDTVTITGSPTGGTFTITVAGQTTSALAYEAAAADVQTAVRALSTVGGTLATVSGSGPYTIVFDASLGLLTVTASGASLTGGTTPAATAAHVASNIELGDDGSGSNVWSAPFSGTNARLVCQPSQSIMLATGSKAGFVVDSSHKSLLITNLGSVAVTGVMLLCGEGS